MHHLSTIPGAQESINWSKAAWLVATTSLLGLSGCVGSYGDPETKGLQMYFASGAVHYSVTDAPALDPSDATLMAAGWQGFGFSPAALNLTMNAGEMLSYLESPDLHFVYFTGHGLPEGPASNDVVVTPNGVATRNADGVLTPQPGQQRLRIAPPYVMLANCQSGKADWSVAFTDTTRAVFGYTVDTVDLDDNDVATHYVECLDHEWVESKLWTTNQHLNCWVRANEAVGGYFAEGWIAYVRDNENEIWRIEPDGESVVRHMNSSTP